MKSEHSRRSATQQLLDKCSPRDFDGHTDFRKLSLAQRLEWLSKAARDIHEMRRRLKRQ